MTWFVVTVDGTGITLNVKPPRRRRWNAHIAWDSIVRICFRAEPVGVSDGVYVFTESRRESWTIPLEATGAAEMWDQLIQRGIFDPELAIAAAGATDGIFCWPPD